MHYELCKYKRSFTEFFFPRRGTPLGNPVSAPGYMEVCIVILYNYISREFFAIFMGFHVENYRSYNLVRKYKGFMNGCLI